MGKGAKAVNKYKNKRLEEERRAELEEAQKKFERSQSKKKLAAQIENMKRDVVFKIDQVKSGDIVETRTIHRLPDGSATIVDGYVNNLKPKHILENEITEYNAKIEMFQEQIDEIKKIEEQENARETTEED